MKPFNVEAALAGAPVITRDGRKVTQITKFEGIDWPVRAVIEGNTHLSCFSLKGSAGHARCSYSDLFMAHVKKKGWINIYPQNRALPNTIGSVGWIYETEEAARKNNTQGSLPPIQIEWEE